MWPAGLGKFARDMFLMKWSTRRLPKPRTSMLMDERVNGSFLAGEDATSGTAIDATIVPIDGGMSLFVKMTGPAETVTNNPTQSRRFSNRSS